ncbi:hypothetical protein F5Y09DRAFT_330015 [Xylaria sp. FL1042]|nr:hypothetical protein F5Y09DRAFT_330015 [Xylaria sp. FL1042]
MGYTTPTKLRQIQIEIRRHDIDSFGNIVATKAVHSNDHGRFHADLLSKCPAHLWPKGSYRATSPRPMLVTKSHQQQIVELSKALTTAIISIVERWWSDQDARFYERMPLKREEEDLLKWLENQVTLGNLKEYAVCLGSWRPDFLVEERAGCQDEAAVENFLITEINARFSFNGTFYAAYGQEVLDDMNLGELKLASTTAPALIFDGLGSLFDSSVPLHLLIGEEAGMDIHMFVAAAREKFDITPRLISPADLRLEPNPQTGNGYRLCCLAQENKDPAMFPSPSAFVNSKGETVEEIQQVGLELHQHELFALPREMLRQIGLRCFNDLRTILLVHDKRMLGIVKQELQQLVRTQVLTPDQAQALDEGIVDTFLPGSPQMHSLLQSSMSSPRLKDEYILKPIRSGKGAGIIFGGDLTSDEWESILAKLQTQPPLLEKTYVVQRRVSHCLYDLVLHASGEKLRYPLVGTWHIMHGKFSGLGIWRSSGDRICAVSSGGSIIYSVSRNP